MARADDHGRGANIFDVARLAGVSHQTVSRVLNDSPAVRPATRERVQLAIKQLRYQPSPAARALVTRRSRLIGIVSAGATDYGPSSIQARFNAAASAAAYSVLSVTLAEQSYAAARTAVESLLRQNVEAVVLVLLEVPTLDRLQALDLGVPLVPIASGAGRGLLAVSIDQYGGARSAVRHLLDAGYREVLHITGPEQHPDALERIRGWADELAEAGLPRGAMHRADWSPSLAYRVGLELAVHPGRTGVFAGNDQMALGIMSAMRRRGLRVPDDVGVVGFDDVPEAEFYSPPLTTVRQDFEALGRLALRRVLDVLDAPEAIAATPPLATTLVVRSSSMPRSRDESAPAGGVAEAIAPERPLEEPSAR